MGRSRSRYISSGASRVVQTRLGSWINLDYSHTAETTGGHSFEISGQLLLAAATVRAFGLIEPMTLVRGAGRGETDRLTYLGTGGATL